MCLMNREVRMPPRSKNTGNTPNNSGNGRNQQDGNRDCRHNQGQPPEMIQMMQTLVGVVQQQVTTGDNLARMMDQRRGNVDTLFCNPYLTSHEG